MDYKKLIAEKALDRLGEIIVTDVEWNTLFRTCSLGIEDYQWDKWNDIHKDLDVTGLDLEWDISDRDAGRFFRVRSFAVTEGDTTYLIHHIFEVSDYMGLFQDLSAYSRQWQDESEIDHLTGLYNKGKFNSLYKKEFPKYNSIAVFNMDVNYLKRTNDTYGHEAGNKLLLKAASSIKSVLTENSYGFRVGGDEFMMIFKDTDETEALKILEKWKRELDKLNRLDPDIECVIACGMVVETAPYDMRHVLRRADDLMYQNKRNMKIARGEDPDSR